MRNIALLAILAGAMLAGTALAGMARAADEEDKIDCTSTDLGFTDSSFVADCADLSRSSINTEGGVAGATAKKLFAIRKSPGVTFVLAVDLSVRGTRVYFRREGLSEEISGNFTEVGVSGWASANSFSSFETATFTGTFDKGTDLNCIAFRREVNRRYEGVGRKVIGMACTSQDVDAARQALKSLKAPGE
jgi:hypothetical protein